MNLKIYLFVIAFTSMHSCISQKANTISAGNTNPFFVYNFGGLEKYAPAQQIDMVYQMGYEGMTLEMATSKEVDSLDVFLNTVKKYPTFRIYSVFVRYNFEQSEVDRNRWRGVVDKIAGKGIALWFIFGKPQPGIDDTYCENVLREVVSYSAKKNVPVTLYPHSHCYYYSAEQAFPLVKKINHPNLKLALHLCHELRAGNGYRMDEVVSKVGKYISFVTISGADKEVDMTSPGTMDRSTIQPLNESAYDLSAFLTALKKIQYKGPVGFINFKIDKAESPEVYLPNSLKTWKELKNKYLNYN